MKQLIPLTSKNDRTINAISFNDTDSSRLITLAAGVELAIPVPADAVQARFVFPSGEVIYISDIQTITIPTAGNIISGNAEINPGIRAWEKSKVPENLYAFSLTELTFGIYFYNG